MRSIRKGKILQVQGSKGVPTSDLASDEEIIFSEFGSTFSDTCTPYRGSIESNLGGLVDSNGIKVQSFQRQTSEVDQSVHYGRLPFSETILDGSELGQLTIPVRVNTKGLHVTILIEVRGSTTICCDGDNGAVILPESREDTRTVTVVADLLKWLNNEAIEDFLMLTLKSLYRWKSHG